MTIRPWDRRLSHRTTASVLGTSGLGTSGIGVGTRRNRLSTQVQEVYVGVARRVLCGRLCRVVSCQAENAPSVYVNSC